MLNGLNFLNYIKKENYYTILLFILKKNILFNKIINILKKDKILKIIENVV